MGEQEMQSALCWARDLRRHNKRVEVYPDLVKIKKQLSYADANRIPFVAIIGSEELASQTVTLKNMLTGEQSQMTLEQLLSMLDNYEHQR